MSTAFVEEHVRVQAPPLEVRDEAVRVLTSLAKRRRPYERLALAISVRDDRRMPIDARVVVPVIARLLSRVDRRECVIEIVAEEATRFFPEFRGFMTIASAGERECEVWLQGAYVPAHDGGDMAIEAMFSRGVASRGVRAFLDWISLEVAKNLSESYGEAESTR